MGPMGLQDVEPGDEGKGKDQDKYGKNGKDSQDGKTNGKDDADDGGSCGLS